MKSFYTLLMVFFGSFICSAQEMVFVEFNDKPNATYYLNNPLQMLSQDALNRRQNRSVVLDLSDVPLYPNYIDQIKINYPILGHSKWLNGVVIEVNSDADIDALNALDFVKQVKSFVRDSSPALAQKPVQKFEEEYTSAFNLDSDVFIQQLNLHELHDQGFTGKNIKIAVLDSGFNGVNSMNAFQYIRDNNQIKYTYDLVQATTDIFSHNSHTHGTAVLSTMAAKTDRYTGTAYDADFYLFRTEYAPTETPLEMVHWVMAAEIADSLGVDIINSSLGYYDFDDPRYNLIHADLDGQTSYITLGANIAVEKGIIVVNSAGNERNDSWGKIATPSDSAGVLAIGGVYADGSYTVFSSYGPTADGRIKPDLMALGGVVPLYNYYFGEYFTSSNGTSFSSPIMAGAIACLIQDKNEFTVDQIKSILYQSADRYLNPNNDYGYGIPDFMLAKDLLDNLETIDRNEVAIIEIYPNPVSDILKLKTPEKVVLIELFDAEGKRVLSVHNPNHVNVESLSKGTYFAKVVLRNGFQHQKKVIKR